MLAAIAELQLNNIILGCGGVFSTHTNTNIIVHGHIIINYISLLYIFFTTVNKVFTQLHLDVS